MTVTIKDVAREAAVSISTVSKVMSDSPRISEDTKNKVRQIMRDMSYHPNRLARSFVQQSSYNIGVLMHIERSTAFKNPYIFEILGGIETIAYQKNYNVTLSNLTAISHQKEALEKIIAEKQVDGFLLHASPSMKFMVDFLLKNEFPFTIIGEPPFEGKINWVDIDNQFAGQLAVQHLLDQGYQRPAFIGGPKDDKITTKRLAGFVKRLKQEAGEFPETYIKHGKDTSSEAGVTLWKELTTLPNVPDSVVCTGNFLSAGVLKIAKASGVQIPQELGIISFDNYPLAPYTDPPLSVVDMDVYELGVYAAKILFEKIENKNYLVQSKMLNVEIIQRASTAIR